MLPPVKRIEKKVKSVTVSWLKLFPNLSSGLGGMPRSPVRSLRVRSSICSCTGRNQVRKEKKKDGKKTMLPKNISNLNNKHEELGDFERDD